MRKSDWQQELCPGRCLMICYRSIISDCDYQHCTSVTLPSLAERQQKLESTCFLFFLVWHSSLYHKGIYSHKCKNLHQLPRGMSCNLLPCSLFYLFFRDTAIPFFPEAFQAIESSSTFDFLQLSIYLLFVFNIFIDIYIIHKP